MPAQSFPRRSTSAAVRMPTRPRTPENTRTASKPDHDLADEAMFRRLEFTGLDLTGQRARSAEFDLCRFTQTGMSQVELDGATFGDCTVDNCDWANLRAHKSGMNRVALSTVRLTGLQWADGSLREVTFTDCRIDLASFRFTAFRGVVFTDCNMTRADFTGADLRGARFVDCDLNGAQFAEANCEGTRFTRCQLGGVGGVTAMRGALVAATDLAALSYTLAAALGIRLDED